MKVNHRKKHNFGMEFLLLGESVVDNWMRMTGRVTWGWGGGRENWKSGLDSFSGITGILSLPHLKPDPLWGLNTLPTMMSLLMSGESISLKLAL